MQITTPTSSSDRRLRAAASSGASDPELLIKEARDRQRQRRLRGLAGLLALSAAGGITYGVIHGSAGDGATGGDVSAPVLSLSRVLARQPLLGLTCGQANVTGCGRVGVAIWLKQPANAVRATVAGKAVRLHAGGLGGRGPTYWEGYVVLGKQQLRLPRWWEGAHPVRFLALKLTVVEREQVASGTRRVQLRPGWG